MLLDDLLSDDRKEEEWSDGEDDSGGSPGTTDHYELLVSLYHESV